ncbi:MAG: TIGR02117 family protein [Paracoccaceae bacterium]
MRALGPALRWLAKLAAAPILLIVVWLLAGLAGGLIPSGGDTAQDGRDLRIGLLRGPIHFDFLLPLDPETRADYQFAGAQGRLPINAAGARWLLVGWGSEAFYTTAGTYADVTAGAVLRAATGDRAVMRLDALGELPEAGAPGLIWIGLSQARYSRLRASILADFTRDGSGSPVPSGAKGLGPTDAFWQAEGRFDALRTCNVWVGRKLRAAGLRFGIWTPTPQSVALSVRAFASTNQTRHPVPAPPGRSPAAWLLGRSPAIRS